MLQQKNPYEVGSSIQGKSAAKGRRVRLLDRIAAVLLTSTSAFVGMYLVSEDIVSMFWPWAIVIPLVVMVIVAFLPRRIGKLWQVWLIAGVLTLIGVGLVVVPQILWAKWAMLHA